MVRAVKKPEAIDLLKLYGDIEYTWDLEADQIKLYGPIQLLAPSLSQQINANRFFQYVDYKGFWDRLYKIGNLKPTQNTYQTRYYLSLPDQDYYLIEESGTVIFDNHKKAQKIQGSLHIIEENPEGFLDSDHSGYDHYTSMPGPEMLHENLSSFLEQTGFSRGMQWGFFTVDFDHITKVSLEHGIHVIKEILKKTSKALRQNLRFDDFIGHTHTTGFGLVIKECDQWAIARIVEKFSEIVNDVQIEAKSGQIIKPRAVIGGTIFPGSFNDAAAIIESAQNNSKEIKNLRHFFHLKDVSDPKKALKEKTPKRRRGDLGRS